MSPGSCHLVSLFHRRCFSLARIVCVLYSSHLFSLLLLFFQQRQAGRGRRVRQRQFQPRPAVLLRRGSRCDREGGQAVLPADQRATQAISGMDIQDGSAVNAIQSPPPPRSWRRADRADLVNRSHSDQRFGVAGVAVQQQLERHPGRRDGPGQNHPDHRPHHLPHGEQAPQRALSHHRATLVSPSNCFFHLHLAIYSDGEHFFSSFSRIAHPDYKNVVFLFCSIDNKQLNLNLSAGSVAVKPFETSKKLFCKYLMTAVQIE